MLSIFICLMSVIPTLLSRVDYGRKEHGIRMGRWNISIKSIHLSAWVMNCI
jgi:hypothetical protein